MLVYVRFGIAPQATNEFKHLAPPLAGLFALEPRRRWSDSIVNGLPPDFPLTR